MICFKKYCVLQLLFILSLFLTPLVAHAESEKVSLNFVNAEIEEVIKAVSHITGKNFVVDPRVKGTINIISATPVAAPLAYDILLSTLRMQGFAAVEAGGVTKILPEADAKLYVGSVHGSNTGEKLVTRVFVLKYESAAQLVPVLRPLIPPNNIVVAYPGNNTLVITDYASNMRRLEQIVNAIDQPGKVAPMIIPVKLASAIELAQTINRLLQEGAAGAAGTGDTSQRFILLADARTNSLLLRTDNSERIERVLDLVAKLDVETGTLGNIHVVYLKNAEAVKLAQTLRSILSGDTSAAAAAATGGAPPGSPNSAGLAGGSGGGSPTGGGAIQADPATNALIITAPHNIYNNIRSVIDMLDVRRAQVFVEALIAEVTVGKDAAFGIQWQAGAPTGNGGLVAGGTNFPPNTIFGVAASIAAKTPVLGSGLNIGFLRGQNLGALITAVQTDSNTNVLSKPNLMMLDNEEAKIIVGQNIPLIASTQNGTPGNPNPFQSIERKDVGLTLKIKPQISEGGTVKMIISQEVSDVDSVSNPSGIITNKRSLDTTVLVDNGQTLVLGGLISDRVVKGEFKVPLLGDIPILGWLFKYETRKSTKSNLMIFIRPTIVRTAAASQGLTQDRYDDVRNEQELTQMPWNLILPSLPVPVLPELKTVPATSSPAASTGNNTTKQDAAPVANAEPDNKAAPEQAVVAAPAPAPAQAQP